MKSAAKLAAEALPFGGLVHDHNELTQLLSQQVVGNESLHRQDRRPRRLRHRFKRRVLADRPPSDFSFFARLAILLNSSWVRVITGDVDETTRKHRLAVFRVDCLAGLHCTSR